MPGGVLLTIKPAQTGNAQKQYSLPNIHGDILLTTDAAGTNTSTGNGPASSFTYDPYGTVLSGSVLPANADHASYGYLGQHEKITESEYTVTPVQMGVRLYIPGIGRFMQVDPVEGGGANNYSYPTDPINDFDLTGMWWGEGAVKQYGRDLMQYSPMGVYSASYNTYRAIKSPKNYTLDVVRATVTYMPTGKTLSITNKAGTTLADQLVRAGPSRGEAFRLSFGPAPKYYREFGRVGKALSPVHIHIGTKKVGADINWMKKAFYWTFRRR